MLLSNMKKERENLGQIKRRKGVVMDIKRITSGLLGFPLVLIVLIIGNVYVVDIALAIIAILAMDEYFNAIAKIAKPVRWIGYLSCISIALIHVIPEEQLVTTSILAIPVLLLILFIQVIVTEMKTSFKDIAYTFFGIMYVVTLLMFFAKINGMQNGNILIWYAIFAAWGTDIFAYFIGKHFGKHKFSKISPKKSIEGCIAGTVGAVVIMLIYTYVANTFWGMSYSYLAIGIIGIILSVIGQIGDFAASSIKRYVDIKDYSNLIPGHGGMLDRIDSLIFLAPFAYVLFMFI